MSSLTEMQDEEREVLLSIYDGDPAFNQLSPAVFQYKYGEHDNIKSFMIELKWGENYPNEKPEINLDTFYNRNIVESVKNKIIDILTTESEQFIGEAMTYSLFECLKEKCDELMQEQPDQMVQEINESIGKVVLKEDMTSKKAPKKEQLSKSQKRRQWDRVEAKGEKPRGWDWVDIVKHLSQTGPKEEATANA